MTEKNVIRFRLDGVDYTLKGEMSVERLEKIVHIVEETIAEIRTVAPNYSAVRASTLAALQLAEELLDARDENAQVMAEANIGGQYSYDFNLPKRKK